MSIREDIRPTAAKWAVGLSHSHRVLVEEYLVDLNVRAAAERVGLTREGAYKILRRPDVATAIDLALAERPGVTRARIVEELAKVGFANAGDFFTWGPDGIAPIDSADLDDDQKSVVSEVSETKTEHGGTVRVKLHDKLGALTLLGKTLRMFVDRNEVSGPEGGPIETTDARQRVADRLAALAKRSEQPVTAAESAPDEADSVRGDPGVSGQGTDQV